MTQLNTKASDLLKAQRPSLGRVLHQAILGAALLAPMYLALYIVDLFVRGWGVSVLWGWFVAPALGTSSLSLMQATGLVLLGDFATRRVLQSNVLVLDCAFAVIAVLLSALIREVSGI